jgi:Fe-S-cluster containining protein
MLIPKERHDRRQDDFLNICSHCKTNWSCCHETTPPVTDKRMKKIEGFLKKNSIKIQNPFIKTSYVFPRLNKDGYCVFHDTKTRKCIIHPVKPETCVAGPITFDINKKTGKIEWFIKMQKICPLAGRVFEDKTLLKNHVESAKREINRLVDELDLKALEAILKKDEPETFKIDRKQCTMKRSESV